MLPKGDNPATPGSQRPITCLNLMYKLLTGALARVLKRHVDNYGLLPPEQKALRRGTRGCIDALSVDAAVVRECREDRRDCTTVWLDFSKAFDRVPHKWLRKLTRVIEGPKAVRVAIRKLIPLWRTTLELRGRSKLTLTYQYSSSEECSRGTHYHPCCLGWRWHHFLRLSEQEVDSPASTRMSL